MSVFFLQNRYSLTTAVPPSTPTFTPCLFPPLRFPPGFALNVSCNTLTPNASKLSSPVDPLTTSALLPCTPQWIHRAITAH
mgnify:CR=1 FL=1